jgi:hypothetical protein
MRVKIFEIALMAAVVPLGMTTKQSFEHGGAFAASDFPYFA